MDVLFLGKDNRYNILIDYLSKKNNVECIGYDNYKIGDIHNISKYDMIILPMSGIKNGNASNVIIPPDLFDNIKPNCIIYTGLIPKELENKNVISFLDDKDVKLENTNITIDGMMDDIKDKKKDNICILGYGNIGSIMYDKLKDKYNVSVGIDENTSIHSINNCFLTTNKKEMIKNLQNSDLIINTVPENIIKEEYVKNIKGYILDIASYPYGIDQNLVSKYNLNYHLYSGIPAKFDPERAGKILLKKFY